MQKTSKRKMRLAAVALVGALLLGMAWLWKGHNTTPGERFREAIARIEKACASRTLSPNEQCGEVAKLKPADPLATPEGRFAHSIKLPDPLPQDSGYQKRMTPQEYFEHLCNSEAGEFIYKVTENVDGIVILRPRTRERYINNHLYAPEAPFLISGDDMTPWILVGPKRYEFVESVRSLSSPSRAGGRAHPSIGRVGEHRVGGDTYVRYVGHDGKDFATMHKDFVSERKSRYGFTWRGITRPNDREMGVSGSELIVIDLASKTVLAVLRGYVKFDIDERYGVAGLQWMQRCPMPAKDASRQERDFLFKALRPQSK